MAILPDVVSHYPTTPNSTSLIYPTLANNPVSHQDPSAFAGGTRQPSAPLSASFHLCVHKYSIDCVACPNYDECPYPDRSSSLMSIILPAGITLLSILALLTFFLVVR